MCKENHLSPYAIFLISPKAIFFLCQQSLGSVHYTFVAFIVYSYVLYFFFILNRQGISLAAGLET